MKKLPNKNKLSARGFTLIELLIVISIIGILSGILVTIINSGEYLKQARDARRINDVLNLYTAIVNGVANNDIKLSSTANCADCDSILGNIDIDGTGWVKFTSLNSGGLIDLIQALPQDPTNKNDLKYSYYSNGERFEINAVLESDRYKVMEVNDGGNDINVYERGWNLKLK